MNNKYYIEKDRQPEVKSWLLQELQFLSEMSIGTDFGHMGICLYIAGRLYPSISHYEGLAIYSFLETEVEPFRVIDQEGTRRAWIDIPTHIMTQKRKDFVIHLISNINKLEDYFQ